MIIIGSLLLLGIGGGLIAHDPRPHGEAGPTADELARRVEAAVHREAWEDTLALRWTFAGRHRHLWDRARRLHRLEQDTLVTLLRLDDQSGRSWLDGEELQGEELSEALSNAYAAFINDSFWLNPLVKLFDPGVQRMVVREAGAADALLVSFTAGGRTPGDAYLWELGADGTPARWRMWVSIIPIGGVACSWGGWAELETGARVSTLHECGPFTLRLEDVAGSRSLQEMAGSDPFAPLFEGRGPDH
jgi:hypothetical protein